MGRKSNSGDQAQDSRHESPKLTISVISERPREGKTFVAIAMAQTAALAGLKVALIDLDFQSSGATRWLINSFDGEPKRGVREAMTNSVAQQYTQKGLLFPACFLPQGYCFNFVPSLSLPRKSSPNFRAGEEPAQSKDTKAQNASETECKSKKMKTRSERIEKLIERLEKAKKSEDSACIEEARTLSEEIVAARAEARRKYIRKLIRNLQKDHDVIILDHQVPTANWAIEARKRSNKIVLVEKFDRLQMRNEGKQKQQLIEEDWGNGRLLRIINMSPVYQSSGSSYWFVPSLPQVGCVEDAVSSMRALTTNTYDPFLKSIVGALARLGRGDFQVFQKLQGELEKHEANERFKVEKAWKERESKKIEQCNKKWRKFLVHVLFAAIALALAILVGWLHSGGPYRFLSAVGAEIGVLCILAGFFFNLVYTALRTYLKEQQELRDIQKLVTASKG